MTPTTALRDQLRRKIGEPVPEGGTAADTMFSDEDIDRLLEAASTIDEATIEGWEEKLAQWAGLVDVTDGAASRKLGALMENARKMVAYYRSKVASGPNTSLSRTRTRVGKIIRNG